MSETELFECFTCKIHLPFDAFSPRPSDRRGREGVCKKCLADRKRKRYRENRESRESMKRAAAKWRENHPEKYKEQQERAKDRIKERYQSDPQYRKGTYFRSSLRTALANRVNSTRKSRKKTKSEKLIGCSLETWKGWLEAKFQDGMSWENMSEWQIDHIKPVSEFDLTDETQLKECFHYTNTQPLWPKQNYDKGSISSIQNFNFD